MKATTKLFCVAAAAVAMAFTGCNNEPAEPVYRAIGTVLNLKPVLQIQGEKLDAFAKCRGKKAAAASGQIP